jgi:hypothetical protein
MLKAEQAHDRKAAAAGGGGGDVLQQLLAKKGKGQQQVGLGGTTICSAVEVLGCFQACHLGEHKWA